MLFTPHQIDFVANLRQRLHQPLPGRLAHRPFEPELAYGRHAGPAPHDARQAAVLALLYPNEQGAWQLPLIVRPTHMSTHAGQVGFPGGAVESGESPETAVLRELHEELGVDRTQVEILGELSGVYVFGSNFLVHPFVGVVRHPPQFSLNASEVAELLEAPLIQLADPRQHAAHLIERGPIRFLAPHIEFAQHKIWGATCLILAELLAVANA